MIPIVAGVDIDDVIRELDGIVQDCRRERSRLGFFAALYRTVTAEIKNGIEAGRFDDGERMERLDVIFANRYLDAYAGYRNGVEVSGSWKIAFESTRSRRLLISQHLLLGMNAHISLDLGIAAARTSPGDQLPTLKRDFDEINRILFELMGEIEDRIARVSSWGRPLHFLGRITGHVVLEWFMEKGREAAWSLAEALAPLAPDDQVEEIGKRDRFVMAMARGIRTPGIQGTIAALIIRAFSSNNVPKIIDALYEECREALATPASAT